MAVRIPEYERQVGLGGAVGTPRLHAPQIPDYGHAITSIANELDSAYAAYKQSERATGEADALAAYADLRMRTEQSFIDSQQNAKPGADKFTPDFMKAYGSAVDETANTLTSEEAKKRFREKAKMLEVNLFERSMAYEARERIRHRVENFEKSADSAASTLFTVEGPERATAYADLSQHILQSLEGIELEPGAKAALAEKIKEKLSYGAVQGDLRDRPEHVQDWLVHGPDGDTGSGYYSKLRGVESGGRNVQAKTSSAFGPYQFTKDTWAELIKRHPELELTEADRFKPQAQEIGIRAFTEDNAAVLNKMGYAPTDVNLYMLHFLGEAGGPRFLKAMKADPNAAARTAVSADAVTANPTIFREGRSLQDVYAIFARKFGMTVQYDKGSNRPSYYADLTFSHRDALYSQAQTEMNRRRTDAAAAFKQRTDNALAEVAANGGATDFPGEAEFVAAYGPEKGALAFGQFVVQHTAAKAHHDLTGLPLDQHAAYVEGLKPEPGDPFYADKLAGYEQAKTLAGRLRAAAMEDSAAFVLSRNKDATASLADLGTPGRSREEQRAAAAKYAGLVDQEAERLGIPRGYRRLITKAYSADLAARLDQIVTSDADSRAKTGEILAIKEAWADQWPRVYADLGDKLAAPVMVATSGVLPDTAVKLISLADQSYDELTKMLPKTDKLAITEDLQGEFEPYIKSTGWQATAMPNVARFFEQAKKLAAVYVAQGDRTSTAAEKAYKELVGFKYRMETSSTFNLRIPLRVDFDGIEDGVEQLRTDTIRKAPIQMGMTAIEGLDQEHIEGRTRRWLDRNARVVTLPNDSGVGLMVGGKLWSYADGKPIIWTWDQVHQASEKERARVNEQMRGMPNLGGLIH